MLILEQKYTNLNRIYYHGQIKNRELLSNEFYLTTKFAYAFLYSSGWVYGEVVEYKLKQIANIFNTKSKVDEGNLRKFCQKYAPIILKYIDLLKENDWKYIRDNKLREDLIYIIKNLGYDGYFNFEIDEKMIKDLHDRNIYKYDYHKHSPSIGIFNKNILIQVKIWNKENFENCEEFKDFKKEEIKNIKEDIMFEKSKNKSNIDIIRNLKNKVVTLSFEEFKNIVENISIKESLIYRENLKNYVDSFLERFGEV